MGRFDNKTPNSSRPVPRKGSTSSRQTGFNPSGRSTVSGTSKNISGRALNEKSSTQFNMLLFAGCLVGGVIGIAVAYLLMSLLYGTIPNILMFGLMMLVVGLGIMGGASISSSRYKIGVPEALAVALVGSLLFSVTGMALEAIYELRFSIKLAPVSAQETTISLTDYIFCIDDSGSMDVNDPNNMRDQAMEQLLDVIDPTSQVGMLRYESWLKDDETVFAALLTDDQKQLLKDVIHNHGMGGGTNFTRPLKAALNQFKEIDETGRIPVVVLMSDGECALNTNKWIKKYEKAGVTICCIYLGNDTDIPYVLTELAQGTNGIALHAEDADQLVDTFNNLVQQTNSSSFGVANDPSYRRFLLNRRRGADRFNVFAMVERVAFFALLGLLLGYLLYREMGQDEHLKMQSIISLVTGLICGIAVELGFLLGMSILNRAALILLAIVPAQYALFTGNIRTNKKTGGRAGGRSGGFSNGNDHISSPARRDQRNKQIRR